MKFWVEFSLSAKNEKIKSSYRCCIEIEYEAGVVALHALQSFKGIWLEFHWLYFEWLAHCAMQQPYRQKSARKLVHRLYVVSEAQRIAQAGQNCEMAKRPRFVSCRASFK